jgi:methylenetetrahydrofolate dehydrogenase (NADP+) / methenyltetrahydrofolate cyclohydrolase
MKIFDGKTLAKKREQGLKKQVSKLAAAGHQLKIAAVLFAEDKGSVLYSDLKKQAAQRMGIEYQLHTFSLTKPSDLVANQLEKLSKDPSVTGIIIQKPSRKVWQQVTLVDGDPKDVRKVFADWWRYLTYQIEITKDVDGLHPKTLAAIEAGDWQQKGRVMPATAKAVLEILRQAAKTTESAVSDKSGRAAAGADKQLWKFLKNKKIIILGKSDILGQPLYYDFKNHDLDVEMMGSAGLNRRMEQGKALTDAQVVISATGHKHLVTGEMVAEGVVIVDVGEPKPDVEAETVTPKASFITPVPGGVGPMTVISLMENAVICYNAHLEKNLK